MWIKEVLSASFYEKRKVLYMNIADIVVSLIILAMLGGVGFYFYKCKKSGKGGCGCGCAGCSASQSCNSRAKK